MKLVGFSAAVSGNSIGDRISLTPHFGCIDAVVTDVQSPDITWITLSIPFSEAFSDTNYFVVFGTTSFDPNDLNTSSDRLRQMYVKYTDRIEIMLADNNGTDVLIFGK